MNPRSQTPASRQDRKPAQAGAEDAFEVPPIASEESPDGPDVTTTPGAEVGHYGMGYGDPTRHQGGSSPAEGVNLPPQAQQGRPPGPDGEQQGDVAGGTAAPRDKGGGQQ